MAVPFYLPQKHIVIIFIQKIWLLQPHDWPTQFVFEVLLFSVGSKFGQLMYQRTNDTFRESIKQNNRALLVSSFFKYFFQLGKIISFKVSKFFIAHIPASGFQSSPVWAHPFATAPHIRFTRTIFLSRGSFLQKCLSFTFLYLSFYVYYAEQSPQRSVVKDIAHSVSYILGFGYLGLWEQMI